MIDIHEIKDIESLTNWRSEVINDVFGNEPSAELLRANRDYYLNHIADGEHLAVIATYDGLEAGCGSICLSDELPSPDNPSGHCAYLMNIYVRKPFRQHGIAHTIVKYLIQAALKHGCGKIYLETTEDGRPVYTSLGFGDMSDMMKLKNSPNP